MLLKCVRASFNTLCWSLSFIVVLQCMAGMVAAPDSPDALLQSLRVADGAV